jgi:mono/diheme cytochrome c family protein/DNA-binding beta-propeller fold protein YncE
VSILPPNRLATLLALAVGFLATLGVSQGQAGEALYRAHCVSCHGADRLGGSGPALLPDNLGRLRPAQAEEVIRDGRPHTQMPGFADVLAADEIAALARFVFTPPAEPPRWGLDAIAASHRLTGTRPAERPVHDADPMNLFVVVETGDHHITFLDGDSFTAIGRLPTRFALHGGPKFSPDGRFVYLASRDGWISKVDLYGLQVLAEIRAGINTRNLALSHDGSLVLVGNYLPNSLVVLDAEDLRPLAVLPVADLEGTTSRVSAVYAAPPRQSFIVALKDVAEIWELPLERISPACDGRAAAKTSGECFSPRRIVLSEPLDDFFFTPGYATLLGSARHEGRVVAVDLDSGAEIAELPLPGLPHLGSAAAFAWQERRVMATPHLAEAAVSVIDIDSFEVVARIETLGPGFFLRTHPNSRHAWVDVFFGPDNDAVQVIDTQSLEIVATLRPSPGKTAAHVAFTKDGGHALVSVWDIDGALVVYDTETLTEIARIAMRRPVGKYNVHNRLQPHLGQ